MIEETFHEANTIRKPGTLTWILSFTPIPVVGELCAAHTARYLSQQEALPVDEDDVFRRFIAARKLAYVGLIGIVGGIYSINNFY